MKTTRLKSWTVVAILLITITPAYAGPYLLGNILSAVDSPPEITTAYLDKTKYQPGDQMLITAAILDDWGIKKAQAQIENENGWDTVTLILVTGNGRKGTWQGAWKLHDTVGIKEYKTKILATDLSGQTTEETLLWVDPVQSHPAEQIRAGTFQTGNYKFPGNLGIGTDATSGDRLKVKATSGNAINAECTSCDALYSTSSAGYSGYFTGGLGVKIENGLTVSSGAVTIPANQIDSSEVSFNYAGSGSKGGAATTALALSADGSNCAGGQYAQGVDANGNAQGCSAPAAGISGSGTANYVPKWASGTSLGNSVIYDNGNVGIGTTSPGAKLEVTGGTSRALYVTSSVTAVEGGSVDGNGIIGTSKTATGVWGGSQTGNGVYGSTNGSSASGVFGNNGGAGNGVAGISNKGTGIYGKSTSGYSGYFEGGNGVKTVGSMEVTGQVKITGGSPGAGKVLTSDAIGLASWQTATGGISSCTTVTSSTQDDKITGFTWLGHTAKIFVGAHATCSSGYYLTGGGCSIANYNGAVMDSHPYQNKWWCGFMLDSDSSITAWAVCCK